MESQNYAIGTRLFEPGQGIVRAPDGTETILRPKTAQVLLHLAKRGGELVPRHDLIEAVWPGVYVTENGLTHCVADVRRALGPDEALLRTLARRGYLLDIAPARPKEAPAAAQPMGGVPVLAMVLLWLPLGSDADLAAFADILLDGVVGALVALREPIVISAASTRHLVGAAEAPRRSPTGSGRAISLPAAYSA